MKKILIADDEVPIAKALEMKLNNSGYEAKAVFDGQEVVDRLASGEKYDLLILDLIMPKLDGFGVLQIIKDKYKIPTLVASNLGQSEDINKAKELGAVDFLTKAEVSLTQIVQKVKNILQDNG